ncbi:hypothetical protein SLEP1_g18645 [Rubroshorea leprosula]|uniref:Uncharacterized protein n=1 Tax=Rubroshorea leprosula TaxID=152421 RepID=A0AAV5J8T2_9ROSI|nr:hypothetical protein SLEP1_g18645 [Rubroshorea leprosula]
MPRTDPPPLENSTADVLSPTFTTLRSKPTREILKFRRRTRTESPRKISLPTV